MIATQHGKERQVAPPFALHGLRVVLAADIDTDQLGTFTGEIERPGPPSEIVIRKARLAMVAASCPLGFASEASFGPHPEVPFVAAGYELLAFVDEEREIHVVEALFTTETNYASINIDPNDDPVALDQFLARIGFPAHAVIVRPSSHIEAGTVAKGVRGRATLDRALPLAQHASADDNAIVQTDMRAHMNPTRQRIIRRIAIQLAARLDNQCPACGTPGFGIVDMRRGLPCERCGFPTDEVRAEVLGCARCTYTHETPRAEACLAPARLCVMCNP